MTEEWKKIDEFPNFEVSTFGNVRNIKTNYILTQHISAGYKCIVLRKDKTKYKKRVHRLVATTFIPNPENKKTVNHIDHNPLNNNIENLEWFTQAEQNNHKRERTNTNTNCGQRPVWRVNATTEEKLELYESLAKAAQWLINNNLTTNISSGCTSISGVAQGKTLTAYGYKWKYEQEDNLPDEIWKKIPPIIVNGTENYYISSLGRVRCSKGRIRTGFTVKNGYIYVSVGNKKYRLHRLVAQVFIPNPENKPFVNHIDGNKENAKLDNLEWVTQSENCVHAIETGLVKSLKSVIQYDLNMNKLNEFISVMEASRQLNIFDSNICKCCKGHINTTGGFIFRYKDE